MTSEIFCVAALASSSLQRLSVRAEVFWAAAAVLAGAAG